MKNREKAGSGGLEPKAREMDSGSRSNGATMLSFEAGARAMVSWTSWWRSVTVSETGFLVEASWHGLETQRVLLGFAGGWKKPCRDMEKVTRASVLEPEVRSALKRTDFSLEEASWRVSCESDSGQSVGLGRLRIHEQTSMRRVSVYRIKFYSDYAHRVMWCFKEGMGEP